MSELSESAQPIGPSLGSPPEPKRQTADEPQYERRKHRDRAITSLPAIMWRTAETMGKTPAAPESHQKNLTPDVVDTKLLKLYALTQEYALTPANEAAIQYQEEVTALALDCNDLNGDELLEQLDRLDDQSTLAPSDDAAHVAEHWSQLADDLEPGYRENLKPLQRQQWLRRLNLRRSILHLLAEPAVRERYLKELEEVRSIQKQTGTRDNIRKVVNSRLRQQSYRQKMRRLYFKESRLNKPHTGLTPHALETLRRGIETRKVQEQALIRQMTESQRGLLKTQQLLDYKTQLDENGFVMTESREALMTQIADLAAKGYRVFLGGPTGSGKTNLALFALMELANGNFSWVTWTGETSVRDLYGSPTLKATTDGKVVSGMSHGPVTQAVLGMRSGVLHEEFTSGQTNTQMSLKTLWATKPGDKINIQGFNGEEFTKHELLEIATGNLKGRRHQDRETMDPAVAREFKALEVGFMPASEQFDIILATLIDPTGILPLSRVEIEMIQQLCYAAELSQQAYLEEIPPERLQEKGYEVVSTTREPAVLTRVFFDTGTMLDLFRGWRASGIPLKTYLSEELDRFVNNNIHLKELPQEHATLTRILLRYGFTLNSARSPFYRPIHTPSRADLRPYQKPTDLHFLMERQAPSDEDEFADKTPPAGKDKPPEPPKPEVPIVKGVGKLLDSTETDALLASLNSLYQAADLSSANTEPALASLENERSTELLESLRDFYSRRDKYEYVGPFQDGRAVVEKDGKQWHIKEDGTELSKERYDKVDFFKDGRAVVEKDGKQWHIRRDGKRLYAESYDFVTQFNGGKALVQQGDRKELIDIDGNNIPDRETTPGDESIAIVRQLKATYGDSNVGTMQEGRVWTRSVMGGVVYCNAAGQKLNEKVYDDGLPFSEGRALVKYKGVWCFIKRDGTALSTKVYRVANSFENGVARVTEFEAANGKPGETYFIDIDGNRIEQLPLPPEFKAQQRLKTAPRQALTTPPSLPGSSTMRTVGSDELIDQTNQPISRQETTPTKLSRFERSKLAKRWKKQGLVDQVLVDTLEEDCFVVIKNGKRNLMRLDGTTLFTRWKTIVEPFQEGLAMVGEPKSIYFVRPNGTRLNAIPLYEAESFNNGWARVKETQSEPWKLMNTSGSIVEIPAF